HGSPQGEFQDAVLAATEAQPSEVLALEQDGRPRESRGEPRSGDERRGKHRQRGSWKARQGLDERFARYRPAISPGRQVHLIIITETWCLNWSVLTARTVTIHCAIASTASAVAACWTSSTTRRRWSIFAC